MGLFDELIEALQAQDLKPGESISFRQLCKQSGLSTHKWAERFNSVGIIMMISEELEEAGFVVKTKQYGRRHGWRFELADR